jgi:hypothetical protein
VSLSSGLFKRDDVELAKITWIARPVPETRNHDQERGPLLLMRAHDLVNPGALRIEFVIRNMFEYLPFGKIPHWEIVANNDDPSDIARDHLLDDFMNLA